MEVFRDLQEHTSLLGIFSSEDNVSLVGSDLMRCISPLINNILKDVPCCSSYMLFIPDVSKNAIDSVISLVTKGIDTSESISIQNIKEIQEAANMLEIDLYDLDYVDKSPVQPSKTTDEMLAPINTNSPDEANVGDHVANNKTGESD